MPKDFNLLDMTRDGQATVLRGFAKQIQMLQVPQLGVVRRIAKEVGLVVLTAQEFKQLNAVIKDVTEDVTEMMADVEIASEMHKGSDTKLKAIEFILASGTQKDAEFKLGQIANVLKRE